MIDSPIIDSIPGLGRSPGEGKIYPLQCSGLENSIDCIVHGIAKSRTRLSDFHFHFLPLLIQGRFLQLCGLLPLQQLSFKGMGGYDSDIKLMTLSNFSPCSSESLFCVQISEKKASLLFRMTYTLPIITFLKWKRKLKLKAECRRGWQVFGKVYQQFEA